MSIVVTCRCGQKFAAQPHLAGKQVRCPVCGQALSVPQRPAAPSAPAAPRGGPSAGSKIPVACRCGRQFLAEPRLAGQRVGCPACGQPILIQAAPRPAAKPAPGVDLAADPLLADAVAMSARAPAAQRGLHSPLARATSAKRKKPFNPRPFIVGGVIAAIGLLVIGLGVAGFFGIRGLVRRVGGSGWQEYTSSEGLFSVQMPSWRLSTRRTTVSSRCARHWILPPASSVPRDCTSATRRPGR